MKAKIFLSLSGALFLILVGGFVSSQMVLAQYHQVQATPMPQPANRILWDYDSGWMAIDPAECLHLQHDLGGDPGEYMINLVGTGEPGVQAVHEWYKGWHSHPNPTNNDRYGCVWGNCTAYGIDVIRAPEDDLLQIPYQWKFIRIRILKNH